jgi:pimeloyl-ACP methyl ester carboxylesterase
MPTLIVHAGQFGLVREDQLAEYERALGARIDVVEVPGGHIIYWDAYDETADAVDAFLQDPRAEA